MSTSSGRWCRFWASVLLLGLLAGCREQTTPPTTGAATPSPVAAASKFAPLPDLKQQPITIRVVYAHNPRFPRLEPDQRARLLEHTRHTVKAHFNVDLRFKDQGELAVGTLLDQLPASVRAARLKQAIPAHEARRHVPSLGEHYAAIVAKNSVPFNELLAFTRPHLLADPSAHSPQALGLALAETHARRLQALAETRAADGQPLLGPDRWHEWMLWDELGNQTRDHDLVLTNQLIASAELGDGDIHTALRGGITLGTTSTNRHAPLHGTIFWTVHPFTSDLPAIQVLRDAVPYRREEALQLAGVGLAHEFGHLLLHLGHPFGKQACVMSPVPLLRFRAWARALQPSACPLAGGDPGMQPGALQLPYP